MSFTIDDVRNEVQVIERGETHEGRAIQWMCHHPEHRSIWCTVIGYDKAVGTRFGLGLPLETFRQALLYFAHFVASNGPVRVRELDLLSKTLVKVNLANNNLFRRCSRVP